MSMAKTHFLKKRFILFILMKMYVYLCVRMDIGSPETGVIGCFELCDVDARNETQVLCKSKQVLLTSELHLQPKGKLFQKCFLKHFLLRSVRKLSFDIIDIPWAEHNLFLVLTSKFKLKEMW